MLHAPQTPGMLTNPFQLLVSLHEKGITHGHASCNPQFTRVSLLTCVEHRNLIEEYVMSKISTPTHPATRPRVEYYFVGFREGQEPLRPINANLGYIFDVGCVGVIFERMFCTVGGLSIYSCTPLTVLRRLLRNTQQVFCIH